MDKKRVVLTGGGSGGHFYPLMAVAERLATGPEAAETKLYYLGPKPYNETVLAQHAISFVRTPAAKKTKYFSLGNVFMPFAVLWGIVVAIKKLYVIYPDVIFSKGSYTSVPVVIAGAILRIPIVVHESDTKVGSANKLAAKWARYIGISYDDVASSFPAEKTALVGVPIRQAILDPVADPLTKLGLPQTKPLLLVLGGSSGASRINKLMIESLDELLPHYSILHQTGTEHEDTVTSTAATLINDNNLLAGYFVRGSLTETEMSLALSGASLIISRAGSGTIFEIAHKGKPSIIIPIPESISHDQRTNAFAYARSGAASVLEEGNLTDGLLTAEITRIMSDQSVYETMAAAAHAFARTDAAHELATIITGVLQEHR